MVLIRESHQDQSLPTPQSNQNRLGRRAFGRPRVQSANRAETYFLALVRVLMEYLEWIDPPLYRVAKQTINDCVQRHRAREQDNENIFQSMSLRLMETVHEPAWTVANCHLQWYLQHKRRSVQLT
jgi:hypothetical protein